jgi:hypothetical protein
MEAALRRVMNEKHARFAARSIQNRGTATARQARAAGPRP